MLDPVAAYRPFAAFSAWQALTVGAGWDEFLSLLEAARDDVTQAELDAALTFAIRSAALESGAIEGLYATSRGVTLTVAVQGALWEAELDKLGTDVRGHFEAQLSAYELALDAVTKRTPISEAWLRELHAAVTAAQTTYRVLTPAGQQEHALPHGEYKSQPNNVILRDGRTHWYAPVAEVAPEMHRLMTELRSPEFQTAHPVIQAAFAHHALTAIHPFADGNGRAARALASVFLFRAAGIPLVIFSDQQERYWDALNEADEERPHAFVRFIEERALDTMALLTDRLREAKNPLDEQIARIRSRFDAHGGLPHSQVQAVGQRLTGEIHQALTSQCNALLPQPDIGVSFTSRADSVQCTFWDKPYHPLAVGGMLTVELKCSAPVPATAQATPVIGLSNDPRAAFSFIVIDANRQSIQPLLLRIADLHPSLTAAASSRIEGWVKQLLSAALTDLDRGIEAGLRGAGLTAR